MPSKKNIPKTNYFVRKPISWSHTSNLANQSYFLFQENILKTRQNKFFSTHCLSNFIYVIFPQCLTSCVCFQGSSDQTLVYRSDPMQESLCTILIISYSFLSSFHRWCGVFSCIYLPQYAKSLLDHAENV